MNKSREKDILLIDKPSGITSFDVIRILRKKLDIKKIGHAGTLDPLATGLMILGIGPGTKKLTDYIKLDKIYEAKVLLGKQTTTGDMEGKILASKEVMEIDIREVEKTLSRLTGDIILPVPAFSAVKQAGQPLYKKARQGEEFTPPKRIMKIFWIKLLDHYQENNYYVLDLKIKVGSGTYIRSIAEAIGKRLGLPATLQALRRIEIGKFSIRNSQKLC